MHCVSWTYPAPASLTKDKADQLFAQVADMYVGVPGLVRKYFGYSEDGRTVVGIYLWRSKADADAFYNPEWIAGVTSRWGVMPERTDWEIPQVVESEEARVIREPLYAAAAE
jgi:hypothetical protein